MTSTVVRQGPGHENPGQLKEIRIACDNMNCDAVVTDEIIRAGGGLREMGWESVFHDHAMRHYCPDHRRNQE